MGWNTTYRVDNSEGIALVEHYHSSVRDTFSEGNVYST